MKLSTLVLLLAAITILSCQKELSSESNTAGTGGGSGSGSGGGGGTNSDSLYLYKFVDTDSLSTDSLAIYIDFDTQKRVTLIHSIESGNYIDSSNRFFYNGNNQLPYETLKYPWNDEVYHFYDAQNKLISDSVTNLHDTGHIIYNTRSYTVYNYSYLANLIIANGTHRAYDPGTGISQVFTTRDTSKIDNSGNIIYTTLNLFADTTSISYTNNHNPVTKLNIFSSLSFFRNYDDVEFLQSPNLWITELHTSRVISDNFSHTQSNIIYNANGYPLSSTIIESDLWSGLPPEYFKRHYYYKVL